MKLSATLDMKKTASLLKKAATKYGDDQEQAVARLAVATGRELAVMTPIRGTNTRKQQEWHIMGGMQNSCKIVNARDFKKLQKSKNASDIHFVISADILDQLLDDNRTDKGGIKRRNKDDKFVVTTQTFNACYKERKKRAGKAKGAWLGAGEKAAGKQKGNDKITIGKNFMAYAQKHKSRGNATFHGGLLGNRYCTLINSFYHAGLAHVVNAATKNGATLMAKRKVLKWYRKANKANALKNK